jgi:hypothetical protein
MTRQRGARYGQVSEVGQVDAEPVYERCGGVVGGGRTQLTSSLSAGHGQCGRRMQNFTRWSDRTGDPTRTALGRIGRTRPWTSLAGTGVGGRWS